jgi:hypothetical protein
MSAPPRILLCGIGAVLIASSVFSEDLPGKQRSDIVRMKLERLAAAHSDVQRYQRERRDHEDLSLTATSFGLRDFRAILHAHAEDSTHTGGTRAEMLRDAKKADVSVVFISDHFRPPRDFMDSWRGLRDGVLFIPGAETHGLVIHPDRSVMDVMKGAAKDVITAVGKGSGLSFLSHVEERVDHSMDGLTGMEIYNRHADAMDDRVALLLFASKLTDPVGVAELEKALRLYPDELLAAQMNYPSVYMRKWDVESRTSRVVGIAANDCHHNQVWLVKKVDDQTVRIGTIVDKDEKMRIVSSKIAPGVVQLVKGHAVGDVVVRLDFDPYFRSFRSVSTHILARDLTEPAMRDALRQGHAYVSHDWMCDPTGFLVWVERDGKRIGILGDQIRFARGDVVVVQSPLRCKLRVLEDGKAVETTMGSDLRFTIPRKATYRVEAWLSIDAEERPWIYANPIYVR